ncbi:MAM domain containing protein [Euroglyphus maynei]|uniref:MAM domain containing protein n=1 Tax=Euroglyphus maynei TaxID=6958 RepID=A0A1Y3BNM1_EURMA|nr:MAM domain containing protein [Euroglyphus maynei]
MIVNNIVLHKSKRPFQFIIRGILNYENTRIAIDDLSYSLHCINQTISPTHSPPTKGPITTGNPPFIHHDHHHGAGLVLAAIMIPILLLIGIMGGYYGYRRQSYRNNRLNRSFITMFMRTDETIILK